MPSEHYSEDNDNSATQAQYSVPMQLAVLNSLNGSGESPDLLRRRADLLLDEMLLGGADIGSGFHGNGTQPNNGMHSSFANGIDHHALRGQNATSLNIGHPISTSSNTSYPNTSSHNDRTSTVNGHHNETLSSIARSTPTGSTPTGSISPEIVHALDQSSSTGAMRSNTQSPTSQAAKAPSRETISNYQAPVNDASPTTGIVAETNSVTPPQPLLVSAEQRYARLAESVSVAPSVENHQNPSEGMQIRATAQPDPHGLGPVRRNEAAGTMAVGNRASKYSTLLPRESSSDPETLAREIANLGTQIATSMPAGHESRERAQKLLDKANTILQADPLRSAEVDYYLQQVRAMIERLRQSFGFSTLYQQRLRTYLFAWLLLSLVVISGCFLYGANGVEFVSPMAQWSEQNLANQHLIALIITIFAGGLGGAICALWGMRAQLKHESGFLDRKFSLRSMILPITGFVAGFIIYLILGAIYWGLGWNPSSNLWIALVPILFAFFLAVGQEMLLGFRT